MDFERDESEFMLEQKKNQERLDNLYWKKYSNWYSKFKKFDDEEFKKIEGYLGFYFISNYGQVISFQEKLPQTRRFSLINGYLGVNLSLFGAAKFYSVHELVYSHFVGERKSDRAVVHINGVVTDNYYKNLRLARPGENKRKREKKYDFSLSNRIEAEKPGKRVQEIPIMQFDKDGKFTREYPSIKKASAATGINRNSIKFGLTGKTRLVKGWQWRYKNDPQFADGTHDIEAVRCPLHIRAQSLLQFDLQGKFIREYPSIMEASRITGISPATISECTRGRLVTSGGYQWRRKSDESFKNGIVDIAPVARVTGRMRKNVLRFDLEGNFIQSYPSTLAAARELGVDKSAIRRALSGHGLTAAGYRWRPGSDPLFAAGIVSIPALVAPSAKAKALLQYDRKGILINEFRCIREAVEKTGISRHLILSCIDGKRETAGDYTWKLKFPQHKK